jgi:uncharacterized protein YdhG (YjbR/CyaY superfamily)
MMHYQANTPPEYLAQLEEDWRKEKLSEVRELILNSGPQLNETMEYKMLAYQLGGKTVFHLNAQRAYVSLYVGDISKVVGAYEYLKAFDVGKGCIRIKKSVAIQDSGLEKFIRKTLALWSSGGETLC